MPTAIDLRKKPQSIKIHVSTGAGVDVVWADGHTSHYDFTYLRDLCPCANCKDERARKAESDSASPTHAHAAAPVNSSVLPMFKPKPKARHAEAIGNYAIQLEFTDGHKAGIYSYEYLRMICPCESCKREFGEIQ
jgi:DUF971 family protein